MPCANQLDPAPGCRGPGTNAACAYCQAKQRTDQAKKIGGQVALSQPALTKCKPVPPPRPPKYKLVKLVVERACQGPGGYWQVVSGDQTVQVTAETAPDAPAAWGQLSWGTNVRQVSRSSVGKQHVTCQMNQDPEQSVDIHILDLTTLTPASGTQSGGSWKLYESTG